MPRTESLADGSGEHGGWIVECPACGYGHLFDKRWTFSGDVERPTFAPSMLVHENPMANPPGPRCHSFVRNGRIEFLSDCTHTMAGQTVDLPEID
jgi:hypothetical protein